MGGGIGSILYSERAQIDGGVEYFHFNAVGHTVATSNASGQVQSSSLYEAYSGIVLSTGSSQNNRLANTKERDFSIGLDNHGMRYYDPEIGRYISRDPIGYPDGLNNYLYGSNSPINHIDPLGLWSWKSFFKAAAVTVAAAVVVTAAIVAAPIVIPAAAAALGASATTVATTAAVTTVVAQGTGAVLTGVGIASTTVSAYEAVTGKEAGTGRTLSDEEQSAAAGAVAGGIVSFGLGKPTAKATTALLGKVPVPGLGGKNATSVVESAQVEAMQRNVATIRAQEGIHRNTTQGQAMDATGRTTPIEMTQRPDGGGRVPLDKHADKLLVNDLEGRPGPWKIVLEQGPCDSCSRYIAENAPPGTKVYTQTPNQAVGQTSIKSASLDLANGVVQPKAQVVQTVPGEPYPAPFDLSTLPMGGGTAGRAVQRSYDNEE